MLLPHLKSSGLTFALRTCLSSLCLKDYFLDPAYFSNLVFPCFLQFLCPSQIELLEQVKPFPLIFTGQLPIPIPYSGLGGLSWPHLPFCLPRSSLDTWAILLAHQALFLLMIFAPALPSTLHNRSLDISMAHSLGLV